METLSELMARSDVKYQLQRILIKQKQDVVQRYALRVNTFYSSYSYHWLFHKRVLSILQKDYDITERHFDILMGAFVISNAWDCDNMVGIESLYQSFFSEEIGKATFLQSVTALRKAGLLANVKQSGLTARINIKLRPHKIEREHMVRMTDLAMQIPRQYNTLMGTQITNFTKKNGLFKESVVRIITWLLRMRKDLAGSNKDLLKELDETICNEVKEEL